MKALVLALTLFHAPARAADMRPVWGLRGGYLATAGGTNKYFGTPLPMLEAYGDFKLKEKLDLELALGGWVGRSLEEGTAVNGAVSTGFHYTQTMSVIPVLATLGTGTYSEKFNFRFGAGLGVYTVMTDRTMRFDDPGTQAGFGVTSANTTAAVGPHLQVAAEFFVTPRVAATFFMRYAYAQLNESFSRYFLGETGRNLHFAQSDHAGNVAGFMAGYGLSLRL